MERNTFSQKSALEEQRQGSVIMTVGKVLLWMDLILGCFVYVGLRTGSHLFMWWVLGEGLLGLLLLGAGPPMRTNGRRRLAELVPK